MWSSESYTPKCHFLADLASHLLQRTPSCSRRTPSSTDRSSLEPQSKQRKNDPGIFLFVSNNCFLLQVTNRPTPKFRLFTRRHRPLATQMDHLFICLGLDLAKNFKCSFKFINCDLASYIFMTYADLDFVT